MINVHKGKVHLYAASFSPWCNITHEFNVTDLCEYEPLQPIKLLPCTPYHKDATIFTILKGLS